MPRYRQRQAYHFWVDLFKAYVKHDKFKKSFLHGLSANSTIKMYDSETIITLLPQYSDKKYSRYIEIRDKSTGVNLWFFLLWKTNGIWCVERNNIFEVTWQGLILRRMEWYLKLLKVAGYYISWFKRVDICLDIKINTDYMCRHILVPHLEDKGKTYKPWIWKWKYETLEIWNKDTKENTWKFIRVYNKILDTRWKDKQFLYDFGDIKDLTRIELELRRDKCNHFHEEYLTDIDKLYQIFKHEVFWENFQFFKFIHLEDAKKCANSYIIDVFKDDKSTNLTEWMSRKKMLDKLERLIEYWNEFKSWQDEKKTLSLFVSYYKKLIVNGRTHGELVSILDTEFFKLDMNNIKKIILKSKKRLKELAIST